MRVLGIDTATGATVAAVLDTASGASWEARDDPPPGACPAHASRLLTLVEHVLSDSGSDWPEIDRIAVGVGPGGFTGLRIGIATAQGLAKSTGIDIVPVNTLDALLLVSIESAATPSLSAAAIDARRSEVFVSARDPRENPLATGPRFGPSVLAPDELGVVWGSLADTNEAWTAVGDGAIRYRDAFEAAGATVPPDADDRHRVSAVAICRLGGAVTLGDGAHPGPVVAPLYLRDPDAVATAGR